MHFYNNYSYVDNSNIKRTTNSKNIYYIQPTRLTEITWNADLNDQTFTITPGINNIYLKLDLSIETNNYLPNECYLLDLIFGNIEINNINLNWLSNDVSSGIVRFTYDRTIMIDDNQLNEFVNQSSIPFQIRFELNKKPLDGLDIDQNNMNQLDIKMRSCNTLNFNLDFSNFVNINNKESDFIPFIYSYVYSGKEIEKLNKGYFYKKIFPTKLKPFEAISQITEFREGGQHPTFDMNDTQIQFDFFYHDNNFESTKEQHFNITQKKLSSKNWQNFILSLPENYQYQNDSKYQTSNYGSGFILPYGGYGKLTMTIDFFVNQLAKKIIWTWPFEFENSFNLINTITKQDLITNLSGFSSFEEVINNA